MIYLDTHVAVWAFSGRLDLFPPLAKSLLNTEELLISPMVQLELEYLFELGKMTSSSAVVVDALSAEIGLRVCDMPFPQVLESALRQTWTRDPFDRIIVSQAAVRRSSLLTKDKTIRENYPHGVWIAS